MEKVHQVTSMYKSPSTDFKKKNVQFDIGGLNDFSILREYSETDVIPR